MAKKQRKTKLNPNRFQKQDEQRLFSFDPIRRYAFRGGLIAGASGGFLMLWQNSLIWSVLGVFVVVLISNYHIGVAARRIPRWHATVISTLGVFISITAVIIVGTIILTYFQIGAASG